MAGQLAALDHFLQGFGRLPAEGVAEALAAQGGQLLWLIGFVTTAEDMLLHPVERLRVEKIGFPFRCPDVGKGAVVFGSLSHLEAPHPGPPVQRGCLLLFSQRGHDHLGEQAATGQLPVGEGGIVVAGHQAQFTSLHPEGAGQ